MIRMPITLKNILLAKPALERLDALKFPMTTSFRLAKRRQAVTAEIETYEKKYNEIVKELGSPIDGQPGKIGIPKEIIDPEDQASESHGPEGHGPEGHGPKGQGHGPNPQTRKMIENPKWTEFGRRLAELQAVTVEIEPTRIDELQPLATVKVCCPRCKELITDCNPQAITLGDMILLAPLLSDSDQPTSLKLVTK